MTFFDYIAKIDPALTVLAVMSTLCFVLVFLWHKDSRNNFNLQQAFVDSVTGKISPEKTGYMVALFLFSWGFVAFFLRDKLTIEYCIVYGSIFAIGRLTSQGMSVWRDKTQPQEKQDDKLS